MACINLFIARKEKQLTQEEVAKIINVSKQSYYLKESGKRDFNLSEAKKLSCYFQMSLDDLFAR